VLLETGVSFTPGDAYGPSGAGYIRISMGTELKKIDEAMARLRKMSL
jgi:aspartate/methionine/tyrosine aminotransferase